MDQKPQRRTASVTSVHKLTQKVYEANFRVAEPSYMRFLAGQYGSFIIDQKTRRNFSFTTPPSDLTRFGICADITPMGPGSVWLMNLKKGDTVDFLGPLGRFTLDTASARQKVFIATGTGIAPLRSMIIESFTSLPETPLTLYWGLRFEEDIFWDSEFAGYAKKYQNFSFTLTLSRPTRMWRGEKGRVTEYVLRKEKDLAANEYYLCGNRPIIDDIQQQLLQRGVQDNQIKTELFY
jgi:NAD(P)H-flavin reductase